MRTSYTVPIMRILMGGIPMIFIGAIIYESGEMDQMEKIYGRAYAIDHEVIRRFNNVCEESFYDERTKLYYKSRLSKEQCTIDLYKKWKQDGRWDECKRV